ncbi:hypothetical protein [Mangrovimonas xylaniphaga]|uniref:hypothetical protein n=1 Tax=Mangrovimonas xylaniphaga TaxID=1645915 RepID=UPI0006B57080|nr:hypothetical protein [Mangrovimonas xylaniphaga]
MKNNIINIRISDTLKQELEILSSIKEVSMSNLIREALLNFINTVDLDIEKAKSSRSCSLLQSLSFSEFIFWIYEKKRNPEIIEGGEYHIQQLELIKKMRKHPLFTQEILEEIDKIAVEIEKLLNGEIRGAMNFEFPVEGNSNSFNYELFSYFMYAIRYDEENNKVLFID